MINNYSAFKKGYVSILITGKAPEKFINLAMVQGIFLWDIKPAVQGGLEAKLTIDQFKKLRVIARQTGNKFRITEKKGLPFILRRVRKRKGFFLGLVLFLLLLYIFSAFIWFVDLSSHEELDSLQEERIIELAGRLGLKPGVPKYRLDFKEIEENLEIQIPELAWAGIEIKGTRAILRIVEKKLPTEEQKQGGPGDLVAGKNGIIHEILVIEGEAQIKPGETVLKNQLLVSGLVSQFFDPTVMVQEDLVIEDTKLVRAQGVIKARVWYEGKGEIVLTEIGEIKTGNEIVEIRLKINDKNILLKGKKELPFQYYLEEKSSYKLPGWRNQGSPVEIVKTTYSQTEPFINKLEITEAKKLALELAKAELAKQIDPKSKITASWNDFDDSSPGLIKAKIVVETIEDIAVFRPYNLE